tara:strand:+ start:9 stop:923 length:915 start_codon:yes stop_codon:yes gene_type:complete
MGIFDFFKRTKNIIDDNGLNEKYFDDGRGLLQQRFYKKNGVLHGPFEIYIKNGYSTLPTSVLLERYNMDNGVKNGEYEWYYAPYRNEIDRIEIQGNFTNGQKIGVWKQFNTDGTLKKEGTYKNGMKEGLFKNFMKNSNVVHELYKNDKKDGKWITYDKKGKVVNEKTFESGKEIKKTLNDLKLDRNFDEKYKNIDEILSDAYKDEYFFILQMYDFLENKKNDTKSKLVFIKKNHKKFNGAKIMTKSEMYNQIDYILNVHIKEWKKKKKTDFIGFEEIKKFHKIVKMIKPVLPELLQEKILGLVR